MKTRDQLYNLSELRARGWTSALIRDFLGDPDCVGRNPRSGNDGARVKYFAIARALAAETSENFRREFEKRAALRTNSKKRSEAKKAELMTSVEKMQITVPHYAAEALTATAVEHYNAMWAGRGKYDKHASGSGDPAFLERITVNFLRHACTHYESFLDSVHGKIGVSEARIRIKERVLMAIAEVYPDLDDECFRQERCLHQQ